MPPTKRLIIASVVIILAIAGYVIVSGILGKQRPSHSITVNGTVEAIEIDLSPRVAGRIAKITVDEGSRVRKGQIIAVLKASELDARVKSAKGAVDAARGKLDDLLKGTRSESIREARANYEQALANAVGAREITGTVREAYSKSTELKANLAVARTNYEASVQDYKASADQYALVKKGPRVEEIATLKAARDEIKARLENAEKDYSRYRQLYDRSAISAQQLDAARTARDAQKASLEAADARYRESLAGSRPEEIATARARLDQASARLTGAKKVLATASEAYKDRLDTLQRLETAETTANSTQAAVQAAKARLDLEINGATSDEIKNAEGQVEQAEGTLAEAKSNLQQAVIRAPENGVVISKFRELGEVVTPGTPIVRMANLDRVWLRCYAPLPTLGKIRVGQKASVTTDSYSGKSYAGTVASIKEEPEFTPKNVQTAEERVKLVYAIRVDLYNPQHEIKPGMPADAVIRLNTDQRKR